jgi:3-deoxy-manno-octulosonate cytidylyltransferase (CMP-KDO synthetase)
MKNIIVIPARMASSRLPEKPLAMIEGKSLIQRVYEQTSACHNIHEIIVATDHPKILEHVLSFGGKAMMTSDQHTSGTDRIAEVAQYTEGDIFINVQGDEPFIHPGQINDLLGVFSNPEVSIATQMSVMTDADEIFDFNKVKVVTDIHNKALYFSRQAIPAHRDLPFREWPEKTIYYKHIGIYAFRKKSLLEVSALEQGYLERMESLEQLRWLEYGHTIHCFPTAYESIGVDTPEDLEKAIILAKNMF